MINICTSLNIFGIVIETKCPEFAVCSDERKLLFTFLQLTQVSHQPAEVQNTIRSFGKEKTPESFVQVANTVSKGFMRYQSIKSSMNESLY
jgi:hypothetical protein